MRLSLVSSPTLAMFINVIIFGVGWVDYTCMIHIVLCFVVCAVTLIVCFVCITYLRRLCIKIVL